jgi:DNA-binding XRE family transcriptional regulator
MVNIRDCLTLKACRIIANIKAEEMAEAAGVTVDTLYKWEKGTTFPNMPQMHRIVKCFLDKGFYVEINDINFFKTEL